jgi:tetratricopeptide (TPR) repeat protein
MAYMGFYNVSLGRIEEGKEQQNLAAAIALSGQVDAVTGALIYCNILWTCRNIADWARARQWSAGFETWCSASFARSTGSCDLHRAEVSGTCANLREGLKSIDRAIERLSDEAAWALGEGYRVRGDIQVMIGDLDAARADYARAYEVGWDAEPGNALLLHEVGETDAALAALDRALAGTTWYHLQRGLWLRAHKAWIAARAGRGAVARETLHEVGVEVGSKPDGPAAIHAMAAEAQACLHEECDTDRLRLLLLARQLWTAAGFDFHEARLRVEIACHLARANDVHGACRELDAAAHRARRIGSGRVLEMVRQASCDFPLASQRALVLARGRKRAPIEPVCAENGTNAGDAHQAEGVAGRRRRGLIRFAEASVVTAQGVRSPAR